ncbi:MAG: FliM/FliN family flagellar motor switch protein [Buchnera aphidicola (Eriosoma harunire)]
MSKELISSMDINNKILDKKRKIYNQLNSVDSARVANYNNFFLKEQYISILNSVNEFFLNKFQLPLSQFLGVQNIHFYCKQTRFLSYVEYSKIFSLPIKLHIIEYISHKKIAFIDFSYQLVFFILDILFGGSGVLPSYIIDKKELTIFEKNVLQNLYKLLIKEYTLAWKEMFLVDINYIVSNNMYVNNIVSNAHDINLIVSEFYANINDFDVQFNICISSRLLEEWQCQIWEHTQLQTKPNNIYTKDLLNVVNTIELNIQAKFIELVIPLLNITQLKVGDIIHMTNPDKIIAYINGMQVFSGQYGTYDGRHALVIQDIYYIKDTDS